MGVRTLISIVDLHVQYLQFPASSESYLGALAKGAEQEGVFRGAGPTATPAGEGEWDLLNDKRCPLCDSALAEELKGEPKGVGEHPTQGSNP